ncbi:MAG: hypothetical protein OEV42_09405 [Deltaproteobacteria bacterium]|nr:hypothetical protein [Deltaproteobacteria bacterium]
MRIILFNFIVLSLLVSNAHAGVSDIKSMRKQSNGKFDVVCTNNATETVSAESILKNEVCGNRVPASNESFICTGNESRNEFFITRVSDRKRIGRKTSFEKCQKIVSATKKGLVCTGNEQRDEFFITDTSNEQRIGRKMSFEKCLKSISAGQ